MRVTRRSWNKEMQKIVCWLLCMGCLSAFSQERGAGVVIEKLDEDAALYAAGLRVGDHVTHWERLANAANPKAAKGHITDYFDWWVLDVNQAPRGTLRLFGERAGEPLEVVVSIDHWKGTVRPVMPEEMLAVYRNGKQKLEAGEIEDAIKAWENLARGATACWMWLQIGNTWRDGQKYDDAQAAYGQALENAGSSSQLTVPILAKKTHITVLNR